MGKGTVVLLEINLVFFCKNGDLDNLERNIFWEWIVGVSLIRCFHSLLCVFLVLLGKLKYHPNSSLCRDSKIESM